ncbi:hypothetical protein [Arthrospira platensis]|uniref:DUF4258 domain-containing protein n=2 Tax=Oscillatoriales TaxID=1150 RepID=A0A5M3TBG8_LIMPL|nr:hypothetical protein [Arthrospira platensis]AMW30601.1 hypothetical protein AP285_24315 [Arthrospira platensis YZ]KDR56626.1 hypothetical protein APPUASWS_015425 [Arthrospira platensis str. Paraca]MBD2671929.1 hypothetical protein [Arthrospira platensis FACHB-439]MBD2712894.1 hypothetical protein [Arthrospira platensis FACHB-835]MDF2207436.1 hypothetical protein [Arthrospira platensis NCB002]MDT9185546.1 hypothetical protein [Limnospira sp. PMC 289.06]MDT9297736.1 hypothetical protein [Ar
MEPIVKFIVSTPLGFTVRTTENYWQTLLIKHPDITHFETEIQQTLNQPDAIHQSQRDINVLLFYRTIKAQRWLVAVARRLNGEGYLITAYQTDAIKNGAKLWPK